jgi:hypothetical protein
MGDMKLPRIQIGLRLSLLLMALCCVLCAYFRARWDIRHFEAKIVRIGVETELQHLERRRARYLTDPNWTANAPYNVPRIDTEIVKVRKRLDRLEH